MIIPLESFNKLIGFCILFMCSLWLYCSYEKKEKRDGNLKDFLSFFILMSVNKMFAAAGILLLVSNEEELGVPLYNSAFIISNLALYFAYACIVCVAMRMFFEDVRINIKAIKYYQAAVAIFGLVIITVSAFYQAKPVYDDETYLVFANYDPFVYKMTVAILLMSMVPASMFFIGKAFFSKDRPMVNTIMGIGVALSFAAQLFIENMRSANFLVFFDTLSIFGFMLLFYGINTSKANQGEVHLN